MSKNHTEKTKAIEIKEKLLDRIETNRGILILKASEDAIMELCDVVDELIKSQTNNTKTTSSSPTWKESNETGHPSMAEGYPCPPGTKILAINRNTGEFKITYFDPVNMSRDWDVAFKENDIMSDQPALMLNNLLAQLGWFKR